MNDYDKMTTMKLSTIKSELSIIAINAILTPYDVNHTVTMYSSQPQRWLDYEDGQKIIYLIKIDQDHESYLINANMITDVCSGPTPWTPATPMITKCNDNKRGSLLIL